jgi:glycosyltransferase involved in cell wall biosynthesis
MKKPLVSVIALCYNHGPYVFESLESVAKQVGVPFELIIADDASTDCSIQEIDRFIRQYSHLEIKFFTQKNNIGNCKLFNQCLKYAQGEYIVDLATDDVLKPNALVNLSNALNALSPDYGIVFSNTELMDEEGTYIRHHYTINQQGKSIQGIKDGDIYALLVEKYYLSPVSLMTRKSVYEYLGGYDEQLAYEDFDFWVRAARNFKFCYVDEVLSQKRILKNALSSRFYSAKYKAMFLSTARVCQKIAWMNVNELEQNALRPRIRYESRQAMRYGVREAVVVYYDLLKHHQTKSWKDYGWMCLLRIYLSFK